MGKFLLYSLRLRRIEYRIAELPIFLIPMLLVIDDLSAFRSAVFWEGLVIFLFLFAFGDLLNCLADRDLDALYKPHLTEAVNGLGVRGVILQAVLSAVAAVGLTVHLAWHLERWVLVPLVLAGLVIAYAYSVEPLRLKGRGLWQLAFYWLGLFTGPMLFAALLFSPFLAPGAVAVAVAYGMMQTGVILVNTAEDYPEDRQMGVHTAIVSLGLHRGLVLALVLTVGGALGLLASFALLYGQRMAVPRMAGGLLPLAIACAAVSLAVGTLVRRMAGMNVEQATQAVKRAARWVPAWISALALSSLLAAAVYCCR